MQKLLQYLGLSDFNTAFALIALSDACFLMQDKQQKQSPREKKKIKQPGSIVMKR